MKRILTLFLAFVLFAGLFTAFAPKALAATSVTVTDSIGVTLREGAGTNYSSLGAVPCGATLDVSEITSAGGYTWGKVIYSGKTGWIALEFTSYDPSDSSDDSGEWKKENGKWYYYIGGVKQTGWINDGGKRYYLNSSGVMQTGWVKISGTYYYFDGSGVMQTGWLTQSGAKYYLKSNGAMAVGKTMIDGKAHLFSSSGAWLGEAERMTSAECIALLKLEEGFSATPYWDVSQWTVGYGTRCPDDKLEYYKTHGITDAEAEELLREFIVKTETAVEAFIDEYDLTISDNQYDALVMFSYNCGYGWTTETTGIFHKAIKNGATGSELLRAFGLWTSAGGEILPGLIRRRMCEANLYLNGVYSQDPPENFCHVIYDVNGGNSVYRVQCYDSNQTTAPSETPTHNSKTFQGWYTSRTGGSKVTSLKQEHSGKTLYAHWDGDSDSNTDNSDLVTILTDGLNVRSGAGTSYGVVTQLNTGDQVAILEVTSVSGYLWGRYSAGWIRLDYTDYDGGEAEILDGWVLRNGKYYFYKDGQKATGWLKEGKNWYYLGSDGAMQTGLKKISGKYYYLNDKGIMQTGWVKIGTAWYYFKSNGVIHIGWLTQSKKTYYLQNSGVMATGLKVIGNKTYYFNGSGVMQTGTVSVNGVTYKFDSKGVLKAGWYKQGDKWFYIKSSGARATGWLKDGGKWYYLDTNGYMVTRWNKINKVWYYFNGSGVMQTGWLTLSGKTYYLNSSGARQTGLKTISGKTYYFDSNGVMKSGWVKVNGKQYYFSSNGAAKAGWVKSSGKWYYIKSDGTMATGWLKDGGKWYYLNKNGVMHTGWLTVGGKRYYLKSSGSMVTGTYTIGGKTYKFNSSGACIS